MTEPLRVMLVGAGKAGRAFADALVGDPRVQVVGVVGGAGNTARRLSAETGVRLLGEYSTEVARAADADLTIIASPHDVHVEQSIRAMSSGSHVLVEKPVAIDSESLTVLQDAAQRTGRRVFGGLVQRCSPGMSDCRRFLATTDATVTGVSIEQYLWRSSDYFRSWKGDPVRSGGGALINQGLHAIDLALYLLGAVPRSVSCRTWRSRQIDVEDGVVGLIETDSATMSAALSTHSSVAERQTLRISMSTGSVVVVGSETPSWAAVTEGSAATIAALSESPDEFGDGHRELLRDVVTALVDDQPSRYDCELDGMLDTHRCMMAMYESARRGGIEVVV